MVQHMLCLLVSAPRRRLEDWLNRSGCKCKHHSILTLGSQNPKGLVSDLPSPALPPLTPAPTGSTLSLNTVRLVGWLASSSQCQAPICLLLMLSAAIVSQPASDGLPATI